MNEDALSQLYLKDTAFQDLMQCRIFNVLIIASPYDAFMMEEDGRVEEQLYMEYVALNLSSPPRVTKVGNLDQALEQLGKKHFDLIILMPGVEVATSFSDSRVLKQHYPHIPVVMLTPFSTEVSRRLAREDMRSVDYVFSWLGNVDILLAIIKLLEDRLNAPNDVSKIGLQMIMVVEDSVRFYSSVLPHIYKYLLKQSVTFATEALNQHEQMLRMRARPKVILARNYEEAEELYNKYRNNILGVISDVSFNRQGAKDSQAGIKLAKFIRSQDPHVPIIIESSEVENRDRVQQFNGTFIDKNSKTLPLDLGQAMGVNFGFGDFVIRDPETGKAIMSIRNLKDLQKRVFDIPPESLYYHARRNDISRWLYSRAMFPIAEVMKQHNFIDPSETDAVRRLIFDLIVKYRKMKNRGVVAIFQKDRFDHYSNFARIGQGSLGGKGRGLAFIDSIIKKHPECDNFQGITISIPRTVVLCTDIFDQFMAENNLYPLALSNASDSEILERFLQGRLPQSIKDDLLALLETIDTPLAIRSSSLLEDSHYQPFAGIYSTYMIPKVANPYQMLEMLVGAIKGVYASVFFTESKAYMNATRNVIDQEKMAIIIQEVVGRQQGYVYFPSFSGVGRSLNYYPIGDEKPQDGVAQVAVGLGKYIVDGGKALRFSPLHPKKVLQTSTLDLALRDTQTSLLALQMTPTTKFTVDDGFNVVPRQISDYAGQEVLDQIVSTYDVNNDMLVDNNLQRGRRVVTFNNILRDGTFPLAPAVHLMLTIGQEAMGRPVEIEFAGNIAPRKEALATKIKGHIYWLQIRPIIDTKDFETDTLMDVDPQRIILQSTTALGHGSIPGLTTVVYVPMQKFNSLETPVIADEINEINKHLAESDTNYLLIGPGRWGTSDPALGIPVKWAQIAQARLIAETALGNFRVEPSQGTHFFQNLTSFGVGYITVNHGVEGDRYNEQILNDMPAVMETPHVRVVQLASPLQIAIDPRKNIGIVTLPSETENSPSNNEDNN